MRYTLVVQQAWYINYGNTSCGNSCCGKTNYGTTFRGTISYWISSGQNGWKWSGGARDANSLQQDSLASQPLSVRQVDILDTQGLELILPNMRLAHSFG